MNEWQYGFKFLTPYGSTIYKNKDFYYNLPINNQKWSNWTYHPDPIKEDAHDCGIGRLHVMNKLSANFAPTNWWVWFIRYKSVDIVSESHQKTGVKKLQIRRINQYTFWKIIRMGYLRGANLQGANLRGANLRGADLRWADLRWANLREANLQRANLQGAYLQRADLQGAYLQRADLRGANLREADLQRADLQRADLQRADLRGANLQEAKGIQND